MKLIPLTQGKYAMIDDADFDLVNRYKWYFNCGYVLTYQKGKRIRLHRLILNAPNDKQVDHINKDKLDNRRANLRLCTMQENNRNVGLRKDSASGFKGVCIEKSTGHWRPYVYVNGRPLYFGQFKSKHHAALAHDLWAVDLHGEFASTNFPVVSFFSADATELKSLGA